MSKRFNNIKISNVIGASTDINSGYNTEIHVDGSKVFDLDNTMMNNGSSNFPITDLVAPIIKLGGQSRYSQLKTGFTSSGFSDWIWEITFNVEEPNWINHRESYFQFTSTGCQNDGALDGTRKYSGTIRKIIDDQTSWNILTLENLSTTDAPSITITTGVGSPYNKLVVTFSAPGGIDTNGYQMGVEMKISGFLTVQNITTSTA